MVGGRSRRVVVSRRGSLTGGNARAVVVTLVRQTERRSATRGARSCSARRPDRRSAEQQSRNVDYLRVHYLTRGQVDRILKLITAGLAGPHVSNAMVRQMLRPVRRNHMPTTLRALICCYCIHGRISSTFVSIIPEDADRRVTGDQLASRQTAASSNPSSASPDNRTGSAFAFHRQAQHSASQLIGLHGSIANRLERQPGFVKSGL